MEAGEILHHYLSAYCSTMHNTRLQAVMDVASGLQKSQSLSLSAMGRNLPGPTDLKHKIKKVDRLESNPHLYKELLQLYEGLSSYIFQYVSKETSTPVVIDLCYLKDNRETQMLSAEIPLKGRSLPLYREVFRSGELTGRASNFIAQLRRCLPEGKEVIIVMDAGFGEDWFAAIERVSWYWLVRIRQGKSIKLTAESEWLETKEFLKGIEARARHYKEAFIMKTHNRCCRLVTKRNSGKGTKDNYKRLPRNYHAGNGDYSRSAKEPWILATNLADKFTPTQILQIYKKRMQIEESFRDLKSPQFGLGARYARTSCIYRWGVKMLLGAIVQIIYWTVGVIAHSQNFQKYFQANTVKNKKIFSYFYLGRLMFEHDKVKDLEITFDKVPRIIQIELAKIW